MVITQAIASTPATDYQLLLVSSPAFSQNGIIPARYGSDGMNINPALNLQHIPYATKSLAVVVEDPDAIHGHCTHWLAWNIPVTQQIREGYTGGINGMNDYGHHSYTGPSTRYDMHRYYFVVYALDCLLNIPDSSGILQFEKATKRHILGFGILTGRYIGVKDRNYALLQTYYSPKTTPI